MDASVVVISRNEASRLRLALASREAPRYGAVFDRLLAAARAEG